MSKVRMATLPSHVPLTNWGRAESSLQAAKATTGDTDTIPTRMSAIGAFPSFTILLRCVVIRRDSYGSLFGLTSTNWRIDFMGRVRQVSCLRTAMRQRLVRQGVSFTVLAADRRCLRGVMSGGNGLQKHVWRAHTILLSAAGLGATAITTGSNTRPATLYGHATSSRPTARSAEACHCGAPICQGV